jgi:hypothetical protein
VASLNKDLGAARFRVAVTRQERVPGRLRSTTRVSRLPEVSYTWNPRATRGAGNGSETTPYTLQLSVGRYEDVREQQHAERGNVTATVRGQPWRWGLATGTWGGRFSQSWYGTGDQFSVASAWAGLEMSWDHTAFVRALYRTHARHGRTPLPSLDDVDLPHEVQLTTNFLVDRHWFVGLEGRYNLRREDFEAVEYTLARRVHLLQYGLTWRRQPDTRFDLHLRVLGF